MPLKIIDKKRVDLTEDEWTQYQKIITAYTIVPYQKGEDFFIDLFEVDESGVIIFLKPPSQRKVSLEIFLFVMSLMVQQHLRKSTEHFNELCKRLEDKINKL